LLEVRGIGETVARSVERWFHDKGNQALITRLQEHLKIQIVEDPRKGGALEGQTVVVTGTLDTLSRDEAKMLVRGAGGTVSGMVSKKTTFVLAGENPGSKLTKAEELGIPVIGEKEFKKKLGL
jgi:DNA ligase (NAD+)